MELMGVYDEALVEPLGAGSWANLGVTRRNGCLRTGQSG